MVPAGSRKCVGTSGTSLIWSFSYMTNFTDKTVFFILVSGSPRSCKFCNKMMMFNSTEPDNVAIRLVGGSATYEGTVEIYYDGIWGSICDDSWDTNDARVVCRQLGFPDVDNTFQAVGKALFGQSRGPILLDEVMCTGSENNIAMCPHNGWGIDNCDHSEDVGVICQGKSWHKIRYIMNNRCL